MPYVPHPDDFILKYHVRKVDKDGLILAIIGCGWFLLPNAHAASAISSQLIEQAKLMPAAQRAALARQYGIQLPSNASRFFSHHRSKRRKSDSAT